MATRAPAKDHTLAVRNPRTGVADFTLAVSQPAKIAAKAAALRAAQWEWGALPVAARCGEMARWLQAVKARSWDIGQADAICFTGSVSTGRKVAVPAPSG